jgi:hypothetical protein
MFASTAKNTKSLVNLRSALHVLAKKAAPLGRGQSDREEVMPGE